MSRLTHWCSSVERVAVAHQREVRADAVGEAHELEVPLEPPARVLLAEQDHQQRRQEEQARAADHDRRAGLRVAVVAAALVAADAAQHDRDRDDREDAEERRQTVEVAVRILHVEPHRVLVVHALSPFISGWFVTSSRPYLRADANLGRRTDRWYGRAPGFYAHVLPTARLARGLRPRRAGRSRRWEAASAAGRVAAAPQRGRLRRAAGRRAVGGAAAGDLRKERPGLRLAAAPRAGVAQRRAAGDAVERLPPARRRRGSRRPALRAGARRG